MTLLGFDIGGSKCACVLGDHRHGHLQILGRRAFPTAGSWRTVVARLIAEAKDLLAEHQVARPERIGVACGGPLDAQRGVVHAPPNLPGWDDVPLAALLSEAFAAPAHLENDADAGALAEWRWGAGRGYDHLAFLTCGTGLGSGLILGGRLHRGAHGLAGEIGHCRLTATGPLGYGKAGSAEGWASGGGMARAAAGRWPHADAIFTADRAGDLDARRIVDDAAIGLGRALALISDLLDLDAVVVGSIFARQEARLRPLAERAWHDEALPGTSTRCRLLAAGLGEHVGDHACLAAALGSTASSATTTASAWSSSDARIAGIHHA